MILTKLVKKFRQTGVLGIIHAFGFKLRKNLYSPRITVEKSQKHLVNLGSSGCSKTILDVPQLANSTIISCGLGEDGTFDVEFAARYGSNVIIVDPTPRAVTHFTGISKRIGMGASIEYAESGCQPFEAYELSEVSREQLTLEEKALWHKSGIVNFFLPVNESHVSHSITNFQRNYDTSDIHPHIEVPCLTLGELMETYSLEKIPLLKLDVEGAEIAVIKQIMRDGIHPMQISVEYDGLNRPSIRARNEAREVDQLLRYHGYKCYHHDGLADFLYAKFS